MEDNYGKLILLAEDGPDQEFALGKTRITLGRATTNDIVLSDDRVSRIHTRLECSSRGCTLLDLGSSNGSYINDMRADRMLLQPGDLIRLGGSLFRFERHSPIQQAGMTVIDVEADLDKALDQEILPFSVNETSQPRLVVVTPRRSWEVPLEDVDSLSIGRTDENALILEHPKVSRRHAEIQRKGGIFILRDLGSSNGTWQGDERVDQLILQDGDEFRIGEASLVFKSGFQEESLTLADASLPKG
jgi:pSer/pThr/pTyr-binding forkhead associated (FHA) protein